MYRGRGAHTCKGGCPYTKKSPTTATTPCSKATPFLKGTRFRNDTKFPEYVPVTLDAGVQIALNITYLQHLDSQILNRKTRRVLWDISVSIETKNTYLEHLERDMSSANATLLKGTPVFKRHVIFRQAYVL